MTRIEVPNSSRRRGSSGRGMRVFLVFVLLLAGGAGLWTWLTLTWAYSDGVRAGVLQKFSRKGWICKTREGELAQYVVAGMSPQIWLFSVRDPGVAAQLDKVVGERVQLHYTEHRGIPTDCFGDTRYFVDQVTIRGEQPVNPPAGVPPAGVPPAAAPPTGLPPAGSSGVAPGPAPGSQPGAPGAASGAAPKSP
jgi:hypothetical protein